MKALALADIHGHINPLKSILSDISDVDLALIAGDISRHPHGLGFDILEAIDDWCQFLGCLGVAVPGNVDPPGILGFRGRRVKVIHLATLVVNEYVVGGIGGGTGFGFWGISKLMDEQMEGFVKELLTAYGAGLMPYRWILLTHSPPYGTKCDVLYTGTHIGSRALRKLVELRKPLLTVSGHIHESRGVDLIGRSTVINPGPAYRRFYALVKVEGMKVQVELHRAKPNRHD